MTNQADNGYSLMEIALSNFIRKGVWVALKLEVPDMLADGPKSSVELAKTAGVNENSLYRVLRVLAGAGLFNALPDRQFELTEKGKQLLKNDDSMRNYLLYHFDPRMDMLTDELLYCVQSGKPATDKVYQMERFEYMKKNPDLHELYNKAMTAFSIKKGKAVANTYDFSDISTIMDVGGGYGELMFAILNKHKHLKGIIFDQPHVVEGTKERIKKFNLEDRCQVIGGDFFKEVPKGADIITMAHVIHDWDDQNSIKILKNCAAALPRGGRVLLIESLLAPPNEPFPFLALDLVMLVVEEGKERDRDNFRKLYEEAGLEFEKIIPLSPGANIVVGRKK
jgi:ubiquinone/menaquinone biosynthesis C-methylase UbiE